jgi:Tat protein translocase TatB subunit
MGVFLFILESIGTSELILIGIIALMFLGPRKLPQIAKTIGKTLADLRNTTNEFKATWEREVNFEEEVQALKTFDDDTASAVPRAINKPSVDSETTPTIAPPAISSVDSDAFTRPPVEKQQPVEESDDTDLSDKRNWL